MLLAAASLASPMKRRIPLEDFYVPAEDLREEPKVEDKSVLALREEISTSSQQPDLDKVEGTTVKAGEKVYTEEKVHETTEKLGKMADAPSKKKVGNLDDINYNSEEQDTTGSTEETESTESPESTELTTLSTPGYNETKNETVVSTTKVDFLEGGDDYEEVAVSPQAPMIIGNTEEKIVVQESGTNITCVCKVMGFPTPKVVWLKNGKEDSNDLTHEVVNSENMDHSLLARLYITHAGCDDAGTYTCAAGNFLGKAIKKFTVEITSCNY
jgi:hypothetical protein